jgi:hypothetical protein
MSSIHHLPFFPFRKCSDDKVSSEVVAVLDGLMKAGRTKNRRVKTIAFIKTKDLKLIYTSR